MSDWLATHSGVASIKAGLDMNMPGGIDFPDPNPSFWGDNVTASVNNGSLLEERVDDMVLRIMTPYFYLGQDADFPPIDGYTPRLGFFGASGYSHNFTLGPTVDVRHRKHANLIRDSVVFPNSYGGKLPGTLDSTQKVRIQIDVRKKFHILIDLSPYS